MSSNFTIIRLSGRPEYKADTDYFSVLSNIHHEYGSAGSNWDRPNMLLMNGKVVVEFGLAEIAWEYGNRIRDMHTEISRKVREDFLPVWLTDK